MIHFVLWTVVGQHGHHGRHVTLGVVSEFRSDTDHPLIPLPQWMVPPVWAIMWGCRAVTLPADQVRIHNVKKSRWPD
ncbi:hypothetical protein chiPu_0023820 [Chiloscyllium punctatum]|uniref:Uncharacterized protein n=1 Tax=Chiloscyllium punctatum TaxID=137246 RepID=A0A401T9X2_CHIPU|nr:hypothetical protein [Chiloscyllium punctatum]